MNSLTVTAPAKLNLALDVTGRLENGYHSIETIFHAVALADTVTVELTEAPGITLSCDVPGVPTDGRNIACRAAEAYRAAAEQNGQSCPAGLHIHIQKRIPMEAGLGGGSTDGAAVLRALNRLCGAVPEAELYGIAAKIGADVPFFLMGGTAYAGGIGEQLEALPPVELPHLLIAKGRQGVSTAQAYARIDALEHPVHPPVQQLRQAIEAGAPVETLVQYFGNLFETVTDAPEVGQLRGVMDAHGALCSMMTGSGAAVFGVFPDREKQQAAAAALAQTGIFVWTV